jgi:adenylate cyclase
MSQEIERKYLVKSNDYQSIGKPVYIHQGFLSTEKDRVVRIRIYGDDAFLTIKGVSKGIARAEFEYPVPLEDAKFMLENLCLRPTIEKYRYKIEYEGFTWEVDEFLGENEGLVVAEIELDHEGRQFPKPAWIGEEVTDDIRYFNANLVKNPYKNWKNK